MKKKDIPKISDAEWTVMQVIWDKNPIKAKDIIGILSEDSEWKEKTIKTLISRLVQKGVLDFTKEGREFNYYPVINKTDYVEVENDSFLDKIYNGNLNTMFANFVKGRALSKSDINELKKMLDEHETKED